jgi:hypothetical protein
MANRAKDVTRQTAVRVPLGAKPERCHQPASKIDGSGGCALLKVLCGMSVPVRKKSKAAVI